MGLEDLAGEESPALVEGTILAAVAHTARGIPESHLEDLGILAEDLQEIVVEGIDCNVAEGKEDNVEVVGSRLRLGAFAEDDHLVALGGIQTITKYALVQTPDNLI